MKTAYVQIWNKEAKNWDNIPQKAIPYSNTNEITTLAYQLALLYNNKVRITYDNKWGNGHYFHPSYALEFIEGKTL